MAPINGAHMNQPRAQMAHENIRIFFLSGNTRSALDVVRTAIPVEVVILMKMHGIIVRATMCVSLTEKKDEIKFDRNLFNK